MDIEQLIEERKRMKGKKKITKQNQEIEFSFSFKGERITKLKSCISKEK